MGAFNYELNTTNNFSMKFVQSSNVDILQLSTILDR